jgi:diguanylate cyclase (GGDEF)-like protein
MAVCLYLIETRSTVINEDYLRLLIVEESENDAESLANILRNAGHSIRVDHARDAEAFESALDAGLPDMVLCGNGKAVISTEAVHGILAQRKLATPVIAIVEEAPEIAVVAAKISGTAAMVSYDQPDHLQWAVAREITLLQLQHKVAALDAALTDCENRCNTLIEDSSDAVAYIHEGMHCFANQPYMELFGIKSREEIEGTPVLDMISAAQRGTFKDFLRNFQNSGIADNTLNISCTSINRTDFDSTMEFTPASIGGEPCTQIIIRTNRSGNPELEERIETMARQDSLTGLCNRQHFMTLIEKDVNTREGNGDVRALIYITLDRFKEIREESGIAASDIVLCDIARLLEKQCNGKDSIARFGDYSYTILYHASSSEKIQAMGEKLLSDVSAHRSEVNGQAITMTCSIGVCAINEHSAGAQKILSHADTACEVARSSGGNRIHTHSAVIDEQISETPEKEWDKVIRKTIDEKRFYLAYQPIISLAGDTGKRYEALLRIVDEEGHTILPGQFLAIAEKSGFIREIDYWVLDTAFRKIAGLQENGDKTTIFLKLSRAVLADPDLQAWIHGKLKEYQLAGSSVVFEIQELDAANDLKNAVSFIKAMENLQCKVALEHFGKNNQPQLLNHVQADFLKIDGSLIENLAGNREDQARVKALIGLAHENEKQCIAECVDNPGSLAILWQYGVDLIQGNFVQEPGRELAYDFEGEIA